jgi:predicted aspartyl protease
MASVVRYNYDDNRAPPAPVVLVTLRCPGCVEQELRAWALLDTGADVSVVPVALARALRAVQAGECTICGVGETTIDIVPTYFLEFELQRHRELIEVVGLGDEVIAGRNWLNRLRVVLDGPQQVVALTLPNSS